MMIQISRKHCYAWSSDVIQYVVHGNAIVYFIDTQKDARESRGEAK